MNTPYDEGLRAKTERIHARWRNAIYPFIFSDIERVVYPDIPSDIKEYLDAEQGIDRTLLVKRKSRPYELLYTSQERFRDEKYREYQDITITEYNNASQKPGELYKLTSLFFTYGYCDFVRNRLIEVLVLDSPKMRERIIDGSLSTKDNPDNRRSDQAFLTYSFDELKRLNLVLLHWKEIDGYRMKWINKHRDSQ